jgi:hypothetical protein
MYKVAGSAVSTIGLLICNFLLSFCRGWEKLCHAIDTRDANKCTTYCVIQELLRGGVAPHVWLDSVEVNVWIHLRGEGDSPAAPYALRRVVIVVRGFVLFLLRRHTVWGQSEETIVHDGQEMSASPTYLYASIRISAVGRLVSQSMMSTDGTSKVETLFTACTSRTWRLRKRRNHGRIILLTGIGYIRTANGVKLDGANLDNLGEEQGHHPRAGVAGAGAGYYWCW